MTRDDHSSGPASDGDPVARSTSPGRRRLVGVLATVGVVAVGLVALTVAGGDSSESSIGDPPAPTTKAQRAALPDTLATHRAQANRVVDGSIVDRLAELRGIPVVVNQWASWCPTCRAEWPFFQQLAKELEGEVAFLGLDSQDDRANAEAFLAERPLTYPSVYDETAEQANALGAGQSWPATIYFDADGRRTYVHPGGYATIEALRDHIDRYAIDGEQG